MSKTARPRRSGNFYLSAVPSPAPPPPPDTPAPEEADVQPILGAEAIAGVLGIQPKQVYRMLEKASKAGAPAPPIRKVPGLGLSADKATLLRWWRHTLTGSAA